MKHQSGRIPYIPFCLEQHLKTHSFLTNEINLLNCNKSYMSVSFLLNEPVGKISNNVVCATSKASDQPAHTRSLIRAFASRLSIL